MRPIVAISGFKNSGKTTLCLALAAHMQNMGIRVGFIKRTHETNWSGSRENDTGLLLGEGIPTVLWGPDGVRAESRESDLDLDWMIERFLPGVDFVLLEGGKGLPLPRVWVGGPGVVLRGPAASWPGTIETVLRTVPLPSARAKRSAWPAFLSNGFLRTGSSRRSAFMLTDGKFFSSPTWKVSWANPYWA